MRSRPSPPMFKLNQRQGSIGVEEYQSKSPSSSFTLHLYRYCHGPRTSIPQRVGASHPTPNASSRTSA